MAIRMESHSREIRSENKSVHVNVATAIYCSYFFLLICSCLNQETKVLVVLQQSIAHKIYVEILKEKYKNIPVLLQQLRKSMIKYGSYKNLRNLLLQLLSCKISYKIHLKNLKHLPPHSLACEVYRKQMK